MPSAPLKSTAKRWKQAPTPNQKYRDRKRITLPTGTKRDVVGYGPTKKAATQDLYEKIQRLELENPSGGTITMTQLMARVLRHKKVVKGRKRRTLHADAYTYRKHIKPHIGQASITTVTLDDLRGIQQRIVSRKKYRTAELVTILLKNMFSFAVKTYRPQIRTGELHLVNIAEDLDTISRPESARKKTTRPWTDAELQAFLHEAKTRYEKSTSNLLYPVFHTAVAAGLRRGELLGLKRSSLKSRTLEIETRKRRQFYLEITEQLVYYDGKYHQETPKTAAGVREVPIGLTLARALRSRMLKIDRVATNNPAWVPNDLMFPSYKGTPISTRNLYRARDEIVKKLELPSVTLHELRALYATYVTRDLIQRGKYSPKIVQALLRHTHANVALQFYTRVIDEDFAGATFDPKPKKMTDSGATSDNSLDISGKDEDAESVETAS